MADSMLTVLSVAGPTIAHRLGIARAVQRQGYVQSAIHPQVLYFSSYQDPWELCHSRQLTDLGFQVSVTEEPGLEVYRVRNPQMAAVLTKKKSLSRELHKLVQEISWSHTWSQWCPRRHETIVLRQVCGASLSDSEQLAAIDRADRVARPE